MHVRCGRIVKENIFFNCKVVDFCFRDADVLTSRHVWSRLGHAPGGFVEKVEKKFRSQFNVGEKAIEKVREHCQG